MYLSFVSLYGNNNLRQPGHYPTFFINEVCLEQLLKHNRHSRNDKNEWMNEWMKTEYCPPPSLAVLPCCPPTTGLGVGRWGRGRLDPTLAQPPFILPQEVSCVEQPRQRSVELRGSVMLLFVSFHFLDGSFPPPSPLTTENICHACCVSKSKQLLCMPWQFKSYSSRSDFWWEIIYMETDCLLKRLFYF